MSLRNVLHKVGQALHHDSHHDSHHDKHQTMTSTHHETIDKTAFAQPSYAHQETFVQTSTEPDLINGSQKISSTTVAVSTAESQNTVFVDTSAKATSVLDTTYQTLAPVQDSTVVHETFVREKIEEVQPVIHRQVVEPEIHRVVAPVVEHEKKQVLISEKNLGEIVKETYVEAPSASVVASLDTPLDVSTVDVKSSSKTVELAPIVIEHHVKQVIEEIQPVIYKTVEEPELVREKVDIYETVVRAPVVYEEKREVVYRDSTFNSSFSGQSTTSKISGQTFTTAAPVSTFSTSTVPETTFFEEKRTWSSDKPATIETSTFSSLPGSKSAF